MPSSNFAIVILAAGKGTRLHSQLAKVLHRAGGRPLIEHVVRASMPLGAREIFVIIGHQADAVRAVIEPLGAKAIVQEPQGGTGHAMQVAREALAASGARYALVVPGDAPLLRTETLAALARAHESGPAAATVLSAVLKDPSGYGRVVRYRAGHKLVECVSAIIEEKSANEQERSIREVNSSVYAFTLAPLWPCLAALQPENVHKELYLTDCIALLNQSGERVHAEVATDPQEVLGCNTRADLAAVDGIFRDRKRRALMDSGVTIYLPETVLIDPDVEAGTDTVIEPGVQLLGATRIGSGCTIHTGSVLTDAVLDDGVLVREHSIVTSSRLGPGSRVGPFAHLRPGSELAAGARVGNFVEVKKSKLGEGAKAMHLTYIGDATIGRNSNIGAGTITCNYDGVTKSPTTIGERVFVGSGTELVAPVTIGDGAYVAAGSTITENIPADALGIARARQGNKPGWAAKRRAKLAAKTAVKTAKKSAAKKSKKR